jgi:hypothetical protein
VLCVSDLTIYFCTLAVLDHNITYADRMRQVGGLAPGSVVEADVNKPSVKHSHRTVSKAPVQGNLPFCHYCGIIGHKQSCFLCSAHQHKPVRVNHVQSD